MIYKKTLYSSIIFFFIINCLHPYLSYSQGVTDTQLLSVPGISSKGFSADLKGIKINPLNPLEIDFIIKEDTQHGFSSLKLESAQLVKYFLAMLTIPKGDLWVNLSPYEKSRIAPQGLDQTFLGQDMLLQDYLLKQMSSALTNPQTDLGKKFWKTIYQQSQETLGTNNVPINTINKVWIVPDQADIYVKDNSVFIVSSHLRVLLDRDYLALSQDKNTTSMDQSKMADLMRRIILPVIEKQVNTSEEFSQIRQIYHAFILAVWFKKHLSSGAFRNLYVNKKKIGGIDISDTRMKEKVYNQYLKAFRKGAYNFVQEDLDPVTNVVVPRKYFSGGADFTQEGRMNPVSAIPSGAQENLKDVHVRLNAAMASTEDIKKALIAQIQLWPTILGSEQGLNDLFKNVLHLLDQKITIEYPAFTESSHHLFTEVETLFNQNRYGDTINRLNKINTLLSQTPGTEFEQGIIRLLQNTSSFLLLNLRLNRTGETLTSKQQYWKGHLEEINARQQPIEQQLANLVKQQQTARQQLLEEVRLLEEQKNRIQPSTRLVTLRESLQGAAPNSATAISLAAAIKQAEARLYGPTLAELQQKNTSLADLDPRQAQERQNLEQIQKTVHTELLQATSKKETEIAVIEKRKKTLGDLLLQQKESIETFSASLAGNQEIKEIPEYIQNFEQLGQWLRQRREDLDIVQSDLVDRLSTSFGTLGKLENGSGFVRQGTSTLQREDFLRILAPELKINPDAFIARIKQIIQTMKEKAIDTLPFLDTVPAAITTPQQLGELIQERRQSLLLSQSFLAEELDLPVLDLSNIENGNYYPPDATIQQLAAKLKINFESLRDKFNTFKSSVGSALEAKHSGFDPQTITLKDVEQRLNILLENQETVTWAAFLENLRTNKDIPEASTPQLVQRLQELSISQSDWEIFFLVFSTLTDIDKNTIKAMLLESSKQNISEASLQEHMMNKIIARIGTQGSNVERELIKNHLQTLGYPNAEALITERRLLAYLIPAVLKLIKETASVPNENLEHHLVAHIALKADVPADHVKIFLKSVGLNSNNDWISLRRLINIPDKEIYTSLISLFQTKSNPQDILDALIAHFSAQTQAKAEFVRSRLSELGLNTPSGIEKYFGLLIYSTADAEDTLLSMQEKNPSSLDLNDRLLSHEFISSVALETANDLDSVTRFFTATWPSWSEEVLATRKIIQGQLTIRNKILDDEFVHMIGELKQAGQDGLLARTIDSLASLYHIPAESVRIELEAIGFINDESLYSMQTGETVRLDNQATSLTNGHRYTELRRLLNQGLAELQLGYEENPILDDDHLKIILGGNTFRTMLKRELSPQRIYQEAITAEPSTGKSGEGQHERDLNERARKLTLLVLYLVLDGNKDLKTLFLSIYPAYARILKNSGDDNEGEITLTPKKRKYLNLVFTIFGRRELKKRDFPEKPLRILDLHTFLRDLGDSGNRDRVEAGKSFLRTKGQLYGEMTISPEEYRLFLKEKGVSDDAMISNDDYGGINLNEDFMTMTEKGDALSLNINPEIIRRNGFKGFAPMVIRITPIEDISVFLKS